MNFLEYENLYNKTLEKLTQIILEETEAEPEDIVLDLELLKSECYYSYGFSNISYSPPADIGEFFAKGGKVHYSLNLFTGESAYGFIEGGFIGRLEEEFEIEIGDDDFDQIRTVREVLFYLLEKQYEITFEQAQLFEEQIKANKEKIKQEQEAKILWEKEIKIFQFLSNHNILEETLLNLLNNQEIINNWETIEHLIYLIDNEKVTIDDTVKFAYIFQN